MPDTLGYSREKRRYFCSSRQFFEKNKININVTMINRCRTSTLHAKWVSWVYYSENKQKIFENKVMNSFMDVSIGKQKGKNMKICKNHEGSFNSGKILSFRFASIFCKTCRVQFKKKLQNHQDSCNLERQFETPKSC